MKSNRILRSMAIAIILALLVIAIPASPAMAAVTVSQSSGPVGTSITVYGTGFTNLNTYTVTFGYGTSYSNNISSGVIASGAITPVTYTVPTIPGGAYIIRVATVGAISEALTGTFTVTPKIVLDSTSGVVGDEATVDGTGFAANSGITIYFMNEDVGTATTDAKGSFANAIFTVPESYNGSHTLKVQDASSNNASLSFSTKQSVTIAPTTGASGSTVTLSGTGFRARKTVTVTFNALAVTSIPPTITTDDYGNFTGSFHVPIVGNGNHKAEATDGTNKASADFSVLAGASIGKTTGSVGSEITVNGTGFIFGATVTITYDGEGVATATPDSNGAFSATFPAPVSEHGNHNIVASDGTNTKQFSFTMESEPPPVPRPLLPLDGIKAKAETHFDWEGVEDPSGVTYTLQVATNKNFTDASIVLEKELTDTEYTIPKEEKLKSAKKEAPYYWRVSATDGASNASEWSTPGSFYFGFQWPELKGWLLYFLMAIGVIVFLALGFWLGRRTAYY
ncbi:hypothetical protein ACFLVS_03435 [Chloroflexota bacterium]